MTKSTTHSIEKKRWKTMENRSVTFTKKDNAIRLLFIFLFSMLAYAISLFGKIPGMSYEGFLPYEISDLVVLIVYSFYGFFASMFVALLRSSLLALTFFSSITKPIPLDPLFSFISSFVLVFIYMLFDRNFALLRKGIILRAFSYFMILCLTVLVLFALEYSIYTPIRFNDYRPTDILHYQADDFMYKDTSFFHYSDNYLLSILILFVPYQSIRVFVVLFIYELICIRAIKRIMDDTEGKRFFYNKYDLWLRNQNMNLKNIALEHALSAESLEHRIDNLKKKNARKNREGEKTTVHTIESRYNYLYDMQIDDYGSPKEIKILSDSETSRIISGYMANSHPGSAYHITAYSVGKEMVRDASTDGLSPEIFYQVNGYDREVTRVISVSIEIRKSKNKKR